MKKYYTPTEEEFHKGFEYEQRHGSNWIKRIYQGYEYVKHNGLIEIPLESIRVRYLDKEDIESLGWGKFDGYNNDFCRETFTTYQREDGYLMTIHNEPYKKAYWFCVHNGKDGNDTKHEEFRIRIKNKSELKKLFEQLGI